MEMKFRKLTLKGRADFIKGFVSALSEEKGAKDTKNSTPIFTDKLNDPLRNSKEILLHFLKHHDDETTIILKEKSYYAIVAALTSKECNMPVEISSAKNQHCRIRFQLRYIFSQHLHQNTAPLFQLTRKRATKVHTKT